MLFMTFIFLMEVLFAFLPNFVGQITVLIAKLLYKVTEEELSIRSEIADMKEEQGGLSVTDNFAHYARLQRKIEKLLSEVKSKGDKRKENITYLRMAVTVGIYVLHGLIMITLMIFMRSEPLMNIPDAWVSPVHKLVAFPTGIPGAVGLGFWVLVSNSVIYRVKQFVNM